jgi:L,D-peptidoglycan transpeptidase YkuD (ErfK/YbiS/YcfS/YnhG family)
VRTSMCRPVPLRVLWLSLAMTVGLPIALGATPVQAVTKSPASVAQAVRSPGPGGATQELIVTAPTDAAKSGTLTAYQYSAGVWHVAFGPVKAELGFNGLSDNRHEKDGTTPTGTYGIGTTMYGLGTSLNSRYTYHTLACGDWWSGEPDATYNQFVQVPCGQRLPNSEALWEQTVAYQHFAVINFNMDPVVQGRGSAIFLHDDTTSGVTAGCVALPASTLDSVLAWLDPAQRPLISIGTPDEVGPPAPLAGKTGYQAAFQGSNGDLWTAGTSGKGDAGYGMKTGTSPAITALAGGGFEVAFQANNGDLWTAGSMGSGDSGYGMWPGTSPAITALAGGGFEVAFEANTAHLWTAGSSGSGDSGYGMFVGSSPAITALAGHGFEVAFEANNADLWTAGSSGSGDAGYGMFGSTSPAITALGGSGFEVAFQANTGNLWHAGSAGSGDLGLGMMANTSPSIAAMPGAGAEIAFQANTGDLWTAGPAPSGDLGLGMMHQTSPSVAALPGAGLEVAFQANTGSLWIAGAAGTGDLGAAMAPGTGPAIIPF